MIKLHRWVNSNETDNLFDSSAGYQRINSERSTAPPTPNYYSYNDNDNDIDNDNSINNNNIKRTSKHGKAVSFKLQKNGTDIGSKNSSGNSTPLEYEEKKMSDNNANEHNPNMASVTTILSRMFCYISFRCSTVFFHDVNIYIYIYTNC